MAGFAMSLQKISTSLGLLLIGRLTIVDTQHTTIAGIVKVRRLFVRVDRTCSRTHSRAWVCLPLWEESVRTKSTGSTAILHPSNLITTDYYTLRAVGQDDFDDVKVPAAPQKSVPAK